MTVSPRKPRKPRVDLTQEERARAAREFVSGNKLSVVAARYKVSLSTVSKAARELGLPARVLVPNKCPHCGKRLTTEESGNGYEERSPRGRAAR